MSFSTARVRGSSGFSGYGSAGQSGFSGYSGPAGAAGSAGTSGFSGFSGGTGSNGASGFSGYSGTGLSGFSGYSGSQGTSGFSGYSGLSGFSGYSGPSGFSGYSGPSGFSGYSGPIGTSGFSGYSGPSGFSGYSGPSGFSGYSGPSGFSGYSGPTGTSGFSGYSGPSGFSGYSSPSGFSGYSGPSGFSGYSGPSGFSGYSGPVGTSGFSGYSGISGFSGYSGPSGFSGYSGPSGFSGYSGPSGFSGYSGISGFSGYSGLSGFSGYSGPSGFSGYSGPSGFSGYSGPSGFSGYSGISGFSGYSGISGFSGYSGPSGFSGYSGPSGFSGYSGPSGFSGYSGISGFSGYSGQSGFSGYSGRSGFSGYSGPYGGDSLPWNYSTSTANSDPGSGLLRLNNNTNVRSTTAIYIDDVTSDGSNVGDWIFRLSDSTNTIRGTFKLLSRADSSQFIIYNITGAVTDNTGYWTIPVGYVWATGDDPDTPPGSVPSPFSANMPLIATFARAGNSGTSGFSGYSGPSGFSGYSGPSGFSGYSGPSGFSGYSGLSGFSGYSGLGLSGFSGYSGPSGFSGYSGPSGFSGYSGRSGFSGYSGMFGGDSFPYNFTTTVNGGSDPGSGIIALNNATLSSVTLMVISQIDANGGIAGSAWHATFDDSTNSTKGSLRIVHRGDSSKFIDFRITGSVLLDDGFDSVTVAYVTHDGTIANNDPVILTFTRAGDSGFSGYSGRSGFSGYSGGSLSGFSGYSGPGSSGFSGYSGPSGFSGYSGPSGFSGYSGLSGFSGYSGLSGFSGYSGRSGFSGYSGPSGFSGYSGPSGFSGYSGRSGFSGYSAAPAGSDTQIQFNDSSAFGGDADLTWDKTNNFINLAQSTITTKGHITVNQAQTRSSFMMTGTGVDGAGDSTGGFGMWLIHNGSGNRQFAFGSSDAYAQSNRGVFRFLDLGALLPSIDGVTGDGGTRLNMNLGTDTTGVVIGNFSIAYNADIGSKLKLYGQSSQVNLLIVNAGSSPGNFIECRASNDSTVYFALSSNGDMTMTPVARSTGNPTLLTLTGPAHTALTNGESRDVYLNLARTVQITTGSTIANQRAVYITAPTYGATSATQTITTAATLAISGAPVQGTNASLTNTFALNIEAGVSSFSGDIYLQNQKAIRLYEGSGGGTNYTSISAPATLAGNTPYTWPNAYPGSDGDVLSSTTAGVLSWASPGAGGDDTYFFVFTLLGPSSSPSNVYTQVGNITTSGTKGIIINQNCTVEGMSWQADISAIGGSTVVLDVEIMKNGTAILTLQSGDFVILGATNDYAPTPSNSSGALSFASGDVLSCRINMVGAKSPALTVDNLIVTVEVKVS